MDVYESMANFRKMFGRNPTRSINKDYYKWKILNNPHGLGHIYLEIKENLVTGSASITPKKLSISGKQLLGAEIGDTFTHPDYRKLGIFSRGVKKCTEYAISVGAHVIYGTPNEQSLPGYQTKLGYPPCPYAKVKYMHKYFRVDPLENAFRKKLARKCLSKLLSHAYFYFLFTLSFIQTKRKTLAPLPLEITPISEFEKEVDGMWGSQREDYVFFTIRDKNYYNWRFISNPDDYILLVAKMNNAFMGCIVLKISECEDYSTGSICDFITYQDRIDVFEHLLSEAERLFRKARVHSIDLLCSINSPYFEPIYRFGYLIKGDSPIIVYSGTDIGKQIHETNMKWHFTLADSDSI
jgi:hypothetical protein